MFKFTSVSMENGLAIAFEDFKSENPSMAGMTVKDAIALASGAVRKFLESAPEYSDERKASYKFSLAKGGKDNKRSEWSRTEKAKGGLAAADMDGETALGVKLGWMDEKFESIESKLGVFTPELPTKLCEEICAKLWEPALKARLVRAATATAN